MSPVVHLRPVGNGTGRDYRCPPWGSRRKCRTDSDDHLSTLSTKFRLDLDQGFCVAAYHKCLAHILLDDGAHVE